MFPIVIEAVNNINVVVSVYLFIVQEDSVVSGFVNVFMIFVDYSNYTKVNVEVTTVDVIGVSEVDSYVDVQI